MIEIMESKEYLDYCKVNNLDSCKLMSYYEYENYIEYQSYINNLIED